MRNDRNEEMRTFWNRVHKTLSHRLSAALFSIFHFLIFSLSAFSQESTTSYNFLRLPVSAHVAAVGGDNITLTDDDPALIFHNPALINGVSDKSINLNFMTYMEGAKTASAAFMKGAGDRDLGTFSARDIAVGGTFAYALTNELSGGITAKFITSYISGYNALAVAVDLGLNYFNEDIDLSLSAVARNLGGQVKAYDDHFERIPLDLQIGATKRIGQSPFRLSATLSRLNDWSEGFGHHFALGADVLLGRNIYIAAGYNFRRADQMKINDNEGSSSHGAGFSAGAGLQLERFKLHVAYGKYHVSASSILINLSYAL